jgi:hypothetical protein
LGSWSLSERGFAMSAEIGVGRLGSIHLNSRRLAALFALVTALSGTRAYAQGTADIVGTVTDNSGAAITNATVTVKNVATNLTRTAQTNAEGEYTVNLLPIGTYSVFVEAGGFKKFEFASVTLAAGERDRLDAQMQLGAVNQTVAVEAFAAALQTDESNVGQTITDQSVQDLPVAGRNFIRLVQLAPGVSDGPQSSLAGGTRPDDRRQTSTVSANGQAAEVNNYLLDGMDNNERSISTIIVKPSIDALDEVNVQTNMYTAEVGRAAGAIMNMLSKSGTNGFHGTLFEFLRNDKMDAKNFFNVPQAGNPLAGINPEYRQNQFGGSVGGPIIKDKTFFFVDYEGLRIIQGQTQNLTVPTPCELGKATCNGITQPGNFSDTSAVIYNPNTKTPYPNNVIPLNQINSIGADYAALFPTSTACTTTSSPTCQFVNSPDYLQFQHTADVRIDQHFSSKDTFYGRYSINNVVTTQQSFLPAVNVAGITVQPSGSGNTNFPGTANQRAQSLGLSEVHILGPTLLLHLNAQLARYVSDSEADNTGVNVNTAFGGPLNGNDPAIKGMNGLLQAAFSNGGYSALGDAFALPTEYWDTTQQYAGTLIWTKGAHNVKFGSSLLRRDFSQYQLLFKGSFSFSSQETNSTAGGPGGTGGNSLASLLLGYPLSFNRNMAPVAPQYRNWEIGEFVQDDWRITKSLTLNLGLRYDIFTPTTEKHNNISDFDPTIPSVLNSGMMLIAGQNGVSDSVNIKTQYHDFQPRIGFAASLGHNTVLRGGFGTSYYPNNVASPATLKNQPFTVVYAPNTALGSAPTLSLSNPLPAPTFLPACLTAACGPNFAFSIPAASALDFHWALSYMYNVTLQKQIGANVFSVGYVGQNSRNLGRVIPNINLPLPTLGPGGCGVTTAITLPNPCQPYYSVMPNNTSIQFLETNGVSNYAAVQAIFQRRYTNGLTIAANYTYAHALADVAGAGGACTACAQVLNDLARDYGNSDFDVRHRIVFTANYEVPFGKTLKGVEGVLGKGWQLNGLYAYSTGLPFTVTNGASPEQNTGGGADRPNAVTGGNINQGLSEYFDITGFRLQPFGTAGNEGRNLFFSPPYFRFDFSTFKDFTLRESMKLQFRTEFFNLTNSPSFAAPGSTISAWTGTGPTATPTSAGNFGKITATNAFYIPREIQFALKLLF